MEDWLKGENHTVAMYLEKYSNLHLGVYFSSIWAPWSEKESFRSHSCVLNIHAKLAVWSHVCGWGHVQWVSIFASYLNPETKSTKLSPANPRILPLCLYFQWKTFKCLDCPCWASMRPGWRGWGAPNSNPTHKPSTPVQPNLFLTVSTHTIFHYNLNLIHDCSALHVPGPPAATDNASCSLLSILRRLISDIKQKIQR